MKNSSFAVITALATLFIITADPVVACTGFTASDDNTVLAGMNEDNYSSRRYVEIYPPEPGKFGRIFFGYEGYGIQQMINDQGLFYDGFWAPHLDIINGVGKPRPTRWMLDEWMEVYSTVDDIIEIYNNYDWRDTGIEDAMLFFVDGQGNSAIIEGDDIVYKQGSYQAVTNFYQTHPEVGGVGFDRYEVAIDMLRDMDDLSMEYFKDICSATSVSFTIYSIVCNLTSGLIHYYYDRDFTNVWEIDLNEEFQFGIQTHDVVEVFNNIKPDTPYTPDGPSICAVDSIQEYSCQATDSEGDQLYYRWDFDDGTLSNWIGPFDSGNTCTQTHQWTKVGTYQLKVMVRDENCGKSQWSESLEVVVTDLNNSRPEQPMTPSGPSNGKVREEYTYTTSASDPDDNQLYYMWDWGDGTFSEWIGPYNSGEESSASHIWVDRGGHSIRVKAKDTIDAESNWSNPLLVSMPKTYENLFQHIIERLLRWFFLI